MRPQNVMRFLARVAKHEGRRLFVYDDATGKPIRKGSVVKGHPTIGIGRNLSGRGISSEESDAFFRRDVDETIEEVAQAFPWALHMDDARLSVLAEMVFQIGLSGVKKFTRTLRRMETGDYAGAARGMRNSLWARQTPTRVKRLARIMRTGQWS